MVISPAMAEADPGSTKEGEGAEIEIRCDGDGEADCLKAAVELVDSGLGE